MLYTIIGKRWAATSYSIFPLFLIRLYFFRHLQIILRGRSVWCYICLVFNFVNFFVLSRLFTVPMSLHRSFCRLFFIRIISKRWYDSCSKFGPLFENIWSVRYTMYKQKNQNELLLVSNMQRPNKMQIHCDRFI